MVANLQSIKTAVEEQANKAFSLLCSGFLGFGCWVSLCVYLDLEIRYKYKNGPKALEIVKNHCSTYFVAPGKVKRVLGLLGWKGLGSPGTTVDGRNPAWP